MQGLNMLTNIASPSSRRAWIEILLADGFEVIHKVALLAEGVD